VDGLSCPHSWHLDFSKVLIKCIFFKLLWGHFSSKSGGAGAFRALFGAFCVVGGLF
jgi:hypothetical protein